MCSVSTIEQYRSGFDLEPGYLDWASFGAMSPSVRAEAAADLELLGTGRRTGIDLVMSHRAEAVELLAELAQAAPGSIVFQPSTTDGLMQAVFGVTGGVVVSRHEFPSLTVAVARAAESLHVVEPQWVDPPAGFMTPEVVAEALTPATTAVALSLVDYRTGYRADLAAIREVIGDRLLIVDATQGFGVVDADYAVADVVCAHGYKWLRAGRGAAFASFSPRALDELTPVFSGRTGMDIDFPVGTVPEPATGAHRFTVSAPDPLAIARLTAALREIRGAGVDEIERVIATTTDQIVELVDRYGLSLLTPRDAFRRSGIVTVRPDESQVGPLSAMLANHGVTCTTRAGLIRLSAHVGTGADTIDRLSDALAEASQTLAW